LFPGPLVSRYTKISIMKKFIFLLFSILLIPINAFPNEYLDILIIDTDSKEKGEIAFRVCNEIIDEPLSYINVSVEKRLDGEWERIRLDVECPCKALCKKGTTKLSKGQCRDYLWDSSDNECNKATDGEYRFVIIDRWSDTIKGYLYLGASESFFIK